tara:strand:- start:782 stop:1174 length:393 start_codon:yes stop_codon:yes gene_type:complete
MFILIRPQALNCLDVCSSLSLRKLTAEDEAASALARAVEQPGVKWTWAGFGGLAFHPRGELETPWGRGIWGAPPEAQKGKEPKLLAEFAGMKHLLRARLAADGKIISMESTRCHDNDAADVRVAEGSPKV